MKHNLRQDIRQDISRIKTALKQTFEIMDRQISNFERETRNLNHRRAELQNLYQTLGNGLRINSDFDKSPKLREHGKING